MFASRRHPTRVASAIIARGWLGDNGVLVPLAVMLPPNDTAPNARGAPGAPGALDTANSTAARHPKLVCWAGGECGAEKGTVKLFHPASAQTVEKKAEAKTATTVRLTKNDTARESADSIVLYLHASSTSFGSDRSMSRERTSAEWR